MTASFVYFISDGAGHIKIGVSSDPHRRMADLSNRSPSQTLDLLRTVPGGFDQERALHAHLAIYRRAGEWFIDCAEVRAAMEVCVSHVPFPVPAPYRNGAKVRPADQELSDKLRPLLASVVRYEAGRLGGLMAAYRAVGAEIGKGEGWIRQYLAGAPRTLSVPTHDAIVHAHRDLCAQLAAALAAERAIGAVAEPMFGNLGEIRLRMEAITCAS